MDQSFPSRSHPDEPCSSVESVRVESHKEIPSSLPSISSEAGVDQDEHEKQDHSDDPEECPRNNEDDSIEADSRRLSGCKGEAEHAAVEDGRVTKATTRKSCDSDILLTAQTSSRSSVASESSSSSTAASDHRDCLGAILPAMEAAAREISKEDADKPLQCLKTDLSDSSQVPISLDMNSDNSLRKQRPLIKDIEANHLEPREQEETDEPVREGMRAMFDNKFMKAKAIFHKKADVEPLHALALGAMAFLKAMMTYNDNDIEIAMDTLSAAYTVAKRQLDLTVEKKPLKDSFSQYFSYLANSNLTGLSAHAPNMVVMSADIYSDKNKFLPNGVLRAHVIKAESCLLMSILQMAQESMISYLKCGLNLKRAYSSYTTVWEEYKRMGQSYTKYMDRETVSAVQFGIGSVQLILASLPHRVHKVVASLGWKGDKQLGLALLKLCLEGRGIRAPLASLMLLTYYSILSSFLPQLYGSELTSPALDCLLDAQKSHPNSCFFLFYAARIARVARNLPLSTQSFSFAAESSRGEWAEVSMKQMAAYEMGYNHALQLNWRVAAAYFEQLSREKYWSPAFCKYFAGACYEMLGQRTEAILAFAEVTQLVKDSQHDMQQHGRSKASMDAYVLKKMDQCQKKGYQDMDLALPALELLLVWSSFEQMEKNNLEACLERVDATLDAIYEREKMEYTVRLRELVPATSPPDYYVQRAVLLLIKTSILNALHRYHDGITHLNWILDHKHCLTSESWLVPFAYWEAGVTSWGLGDLTKSRQVWQQALTCTKYDFEYRMVTRLSLALNKCDEMGVAPATSKPKKKNTGLTTHGRKRMPVVSAI